MDKGSSTKKTKVKDTKSKITAPQKKNRKQIPARVVNQLWARTAGMCQYDGCTTCLWKDALTKKTFNNAYIAHILAVEENGPRYVKGRSETLASSYDNLMLLCDTHHRLIDKVDVSGHPEDRLIEMKLTHEKRIELLTGIQPDRSSHIILFGANIGSNGSPLSHSEAINTIVPKYFPSNSYSVQLGLATTAIPDYDPAYWSLQEKNLVSGFERNVQPIIDAGGKIHFSLFGLAPMPLLIKLGTLFPDLYHAEVFQRHREPAQWSWVEDSSDIEYTVSEPEKPDSLLPVALNISLSATVTNDRITDVLGDCNIWTITIPKPSNDFLKSPDLLLKWRKAVRHLFDRIKAIHGQTTELNIFPAMPISAAIEFGRVWMPKADMTMNVYDQNKSKNTFINTLKIK